MPVPRASLWLSPHEGYFAATRRRAVSTPLCGEEAQNRTICGFAFGEWTLGGTAPGLGLSVIPVADEFEAGCFGDGSTGTEDDYEHGIYLQMLADRDD